MLRTSNQRKIEIWSVKAEAVNAVFFLLIIAEIILYNKCIDQEFR